MWESTVMSQGEFSLDRRTRGKKANRRGKTSEYKMVKRLLKLGVEARRVPLSGALRDRKGDVEHGAHYRRIAEVKQVPSKRLREWLRGMDALFLDERQEEPLVVITMTEYARLLRDPPLR